MYVWKKGQKVLVPDGYYENGTSRPWRKATVLDSYNQILLVRLEDTGKNVSVPGYSVRIVTED